MSLKVWQLLILTGLFLFMPDVHAQTAFTKHPCAVSQSPSLRGFYLGQTTEEVERLIPGFLKAYARPLNHDDDTGQVIVFDADVLYIRPGVKQVPREEFKDVDIFWHFLDGKLYSLSVSYMDFQPPNLQYFIKQVSERTGLPLTSWQVKDRYHASLQCGGFSVDIWTGQVVGRREYKAYPSITLTDTVADAELNRRREAIEQRKRDERRREIQQERDKRLILKP